MTSQYAAIYTSSSLIVLQLTSLLESPIRYIKEGIFLLYSLIFSNLMKSLESRRSHCSSLAESAGSSSLIWEQIEALVFTITSL